MRKKYRVRQKELYWGTFKKCACGGVAVGIYDFAGATQESVTSYLYRLSWGSSFSFPYYTAATSRQKEATITACCSPMLCFWCNELWQIRSSECSYWQVCSLCVEVRRMCFCPTYLCPLLSFLLSDLMRHGHHQIKHGHHQIFFLLVSNYDSFYDQLRSRPFKVR